MTDQMEFLQTRLFNAVRDTLETMAFAEVTSCTALADSTIMNPTSSVSSGGGEWDAAPGVEAGWGASDQSGDAWGDAAPVDEWGPMTEPSQDAGDAWGASSPSDAPAQGHPPVIADADAYFHELLENAHEFRWARVDVHSNNVASIYLIVSKSLADSLVETMYAGADIESLESVADDTIAELTNTLCGRLMLSLEDRFGRFELEVPETGEGMPELPGDAVESRALVDNAHAVLSAIILRS